MIGGCLILSPIVIFIAHGLYYNIKERGASRSKY